MKTSNSKTASKQLAGNVQLARRRVATAKSRWKAARKQARLAKHRRKEVKLLARRARKQAKQAKADLAEARKALAKAEAKLAKSGVRVATRKSAKTKARPVAKAMAATRRKKAAPARRRRKEVKPVVRRARKPVRLAKSNVRVATRKPVKARPRRVTKGVVADRRSQTVPPAATPAPESTAQVTPATLPEKTSSRIAAQTDPNAFAAKTPEPPTANPENA